MNINLYGHDSHPVIVIGPEHANEAEARLENAVISLYGMRNFKKFTSYELAYQFFEVNIDVRQSRPTVIAVLTPESVTEIADLFQYINHLTDRKFLAISDPAYTASLPDMDTVLHNDNIMYLCRNNQSVTEQELRCMSGPALLDHEDVETIYNQIIH